MPKINPWDLTEAEEAAIRGDLTDADMDALKRSLIMAAKQPGRRDQFRRKLKQGDSWIEVAELAAYQCQMRSLNLKPDQSPPAWGGSLGDGLDGPDSDLTDELLNRMLDAGISQWEPDPLAALAKVKQK
jgi:hypothetical protein